MSLSTTGTPSNGLVYLTMSGKDASGHTIVEQGSGILLSNDEVLTAAHLVYNPDGSLRTSGTASVGYSNGHSIANSAINGVHANPYQNYTSVTGMGNDFAVVHLSTPVTDGTIFSLGSDLTSGTFQVSGYPVCTSGSLDTKTENVSLATGTHVYAGESLHDGTGSPNGSSGGSVYQIINGAPTAFGVISADLTSDTTKGFFKQLTASDVAEIKGWIAGEDGSANATTPLASVSTSSATAGVASTASSLSHSAPGFHADMAAMLNADASSYTGQKQATMTDVAAAITTACQDGGSFSDMAQNAAAILQGNPSTAGRDTAYLAGVLSGTTGTWLSNIRQTANSLCSGSVFSPMTRFFANAGRQEGLGMGINNTGNVIDQGSATLARALFGQEGASDPFHAFGGSAFDHQTMIAAGSFSVDHKLLFG